MEDLPTPETGDASPIDRIEALLSADDAPQDDSQPVEGKQADVPATEPPKDGAEPQEDETPEYQLADMARLLGADESALDVDEDGSLLVKTKIDGVDGKAKFTDLLKSYQLQGHVDKQVREAAEIRKAAQEQAQQVQQQIQIQQAIVGKIAEIKAVEAEFQQYKGINLDALIDSDPVQALKVQRHMQALQERHASLTNEANQAANYVQQQQAQLSSAALQREAQALMTALPEWSDSAKAEAEKKAIKDDLAARGFSQRDIETLSDHRTVLLAREAMLYRQMKATGNAVEKQVRQAPKIIKPGSAPASNRNVTAIQKLKSEVRSTGSRQSVRDYLLATGKV
jgi:hypothetical protein